MNWTYAPIHDVTIKPTQINADHRGWLTELFRSDDTQPIHPAMCYLSVTKPGVARGPHEHYFQTDHFFFISGTWIVKLWDARPSTPFHLHIFTIKQPTLVTVPPGIIHAYANAGFKNSSVLNLPNQLYRGQNKSQPVDEVRHEDNPDYPVQGISLNFIQRLFVNIPNYKDFPTQ